VRVESSPDGGARFVLSLPVLAHGDDEADGDDDRDDDGGGDGDEPVAFRVRRSWTKS
jgi:hypothetical protein